MKPVEITHPDREPAMAFWDGLSPEEQRYVFRAVHQATCRYERAQSERLPVRLLAVRDLTYLAQRINRWLTAGRVPLARTYEDPRRGRKPQKPTFWEAVRNTLKVNGA